MRKKQTSSKKVVQKPVGRRPVLQVRVHEHLYETLRAAADKNRLTISEEAARRLDSSFSMEKSHADTLQAESDMRLAAEDDLQRAEARIEELLNLQANLLNLQANIATDMQSALEKAFTKAGLIKPEDRS